MIETECHLLNSLAIARIVISTDPPRMGGTGICSGAMITIFIPNPLLFKS
ncbi:hypothetical protein BBR01nite_42930 [Brevibacillus brevis]|nr:hypothetical protein BBR01nite_42930 [Brevibacillus brevis]